MNRYVVRLRGRNQITLPAEVVRRLKIEPESLLEVTLTPDGDHVELRHAEVVRAGTLHAQQELQRSKDDIKEGRFSTFASVEELGKDLKRSREEAKNEENEEEGAPLAGMDWLHEFEEMRRRLGLMEAHFVKGRPGLSRTGVDSKITAKG
jgi:bifunctional DNA-binding transcriptional regulator/antitoxin component of YhaV-PrlF toxin-antitoxin module